MYIKQTTYKKDDFAKLTFQSVDDQADFWAAALLTKREILQKLIDEQDEKKREILKKVLWHIHNNIPFEVHVLETKTVTTNESEIRDIFEFDVFEN